MAISMADKVLGLMENTACLIRVHDKVEEISRGRIKWGLDENLGF